MNFPVRAGGRQRGLRVATVIAAATFTLMSGTVAMAGDRTPVGKVAALLRSDPTASKVLTADRAKCVAAGLVAKLGPATALKVADPKAQGTPDQVAVALTLFGKCVPRAELGRFLGGLMSEGTPGVVLAEKSTTCIADKVMATPASMSSATGAAKLLRDCLTNRELTQVLGPAFARDPTMAKLNPSERECVLPRAIDVSLAHPKTSTSDPVFASAALDMLRGCLSTPRLLLVFGGGATIEGLDTSQSVCVLDALLDTVPADQLAKLGRTDKTGKGLSPSAATAVTTAVRACTK